MTVKAVTDLTSCSRPTFYSYFRCPQDALLGILADNYADWAAELDNAAAADITITKEGLIDILASSLKGKGRMLSMMADLKSMLAGGSPEAVAGFESARCAYTDVLRNIVRMAVPDTTYGSLDCFITDLDTVMHGLYPAIMCRGTDVMPGTFSRRWFSGEVDSIFRRIVGPMIDNLRTCSEK